jgi:glycosyltransferase involved in cell wall biosynthesis
MNQPLVSIIVPVKNRSDLFVKAYNSLIAQTHRPIEIIVVDDGSTEEEFSKIKNAVNSSEKEPQTSTQIMRNTKTGAATARNLGFKNSKGSFIQFFDSDDLLLPQKLETEINILKEKPGIDFVYSIAQYIDENDALLNEFWGSELTGATMDYFNFSYQTMCPLYRRSAIEKYGLWDENLLINQDWEFNVRYLLRGAKCQFVYKVHSYFRIHNAGNIGKTDRKPDIIYSKFLGHKKIFNEIIEKKKNDTIVNKLYLKRFFYIFLVTAAVGTSQQLKEQELFIASNFSKKISFFLPLFKNKRLAKTILGLFKLSSRSQVTK